MVEETLGELIDRRYELRATRMALDKEVQALKKDERALDDEVLEKLKEVGLEKASGHIASMGINSVTVGTVEDWDKVHEFIRERNFFHMLERRLSQPAYRELLDLEKGVPGITPTVLTKLSLTKVSR